MSLPVEADLGAPANGTFVTGPHCADNIRPDYARIREHVISTDDRYTIMLEMFCVHRTRSSHSRRAHRESDALT